MADPIGIDLLVDGFLTAYRGHTLSSYRADVARFRGWLGTHDLGLIDAKRVHIHGRQNARSRRSKESRLLFWGGPFCHLCGNLIVCGDRTLDHVLPLHWGGTNNIANLALAHYACNWRKGSHVDFSVTLACDYPPDGHSTDTELPAEFVS